MGMAASQARLLTITARMHDVEYQAQSIQNAKIQLSTQSDQVYQDYLEALDATTLTVKDYQGNLITANFNNLCGINSVDTGNMYALRDSRNRLIVSEDIKNGYDDFMKDIGLNDPYAFALYMVGLDSGNGIGYDKESFSSTLKSEEDSFVNNSSNTSLQNLKKQMEEVLSKSSDGTTAGLSEKDKESYDAIEKEYRNLLYKTYAEDIYFSIQNQDEEGDFDQENFDYYVNIFRQIQSSGGVCVSIDDYNESENGNAANNSEWLKNMIECGKITVQIVNTDSKTGDVEFTTTSPSSDTYLGYTTTTTIDKTALAKAEAEYEKATKDIDSKDKKYDMDLSKLETERTALTTEYESVKKVISDNIERTFGIFS